MIGKALAGTGAAALAAWAVRGRASQVFGPSLWRGPADTPALALTFDDGPGDRTATLLDVLAEHEAPATFFLVGSHVERRPRLARAVREAGHEIGNHSHTHPYFCLCTPGRIYGELDRAQRAIADATGARPALVRAPYGVRWFGLREAQRRLGLLGVMWTVIGLDWKLPAEGVAARVRRGLSNGAIVCLHDTPESSALEALRILIPEIRSRGFKLVTISRLLCPTI